MLPKSDLDVQQTHHRGRLVEQKLVLKSDFRCDQIHKRLHLVKSDLDAEQTHLSLLNI